MAFMNVSVRRPVRTRRRIGIVPEHRSGHPGSHDVDPLPHPLRRAHLYLDLPIGWSLRPARGRVLKALLPPVRCRVEESIRVRESFSATRVDRVGMEHFVAKPEENTQAVLLTLHSIGTLPCLHIGKVSIVVLDGRNTLVERDVKVVIESLPDEESHGRSIPSAPYRP
jgi:hypothetical protein